MTKLLDLIEYRFIGALLPQCEKKTNANFVINFLLFMIISTREKKPRNSNGQLVLTKEEKKFASVFRD